MIRRLVTLLVAVLAISVGIIACSDCGDSTFELDVSTAFADGTQLKDGYSGATYTVVGGKISGTKPAVGLLLLEEASSESTPFSWDNATVYFVITDRFYNGDSTNDHSYGRESDGADEVGTFHGGDLQGLTAKLDYLDELGINGVWITAPYEQIHGWAVGGSEADFKHYGYHGYYALDYTTLDANMGTESDLQTFIDGAHQRGIRVIFDVVMNHPGYGTLQDLGEFGVDVLISDDWKTWEPSGDQNYNYIHENFIDYQSNNWVNWWGPEWVRAGLPGYDAGTAGDDLLGQQNALPDFKTESTAVVGLPRFYANKPDTAATPIADANVRDYLVTWLSDWVRTYGVDGFRADTTKHVEKAAWADLKSAAITALIDWKTDNSTKALDDKPFWMTGEVFSHKVTKDDYFANGFDSLINFEFQSKANRMTYNTYIMESVYNSYAISINSDPAFNVLSYISSHDTYLFWDRWSMGDLEKQKRVGTALLLCPGAVQIYYGDETARPFGPSASDPMQGTRSDMNWDSIDEELLSHWQKLGQFRRRHMAVGAGMHKKVSDVPYAFVRSYHKDGFTDQVMVVLFQCAWGWDSEVLSNDDGITNTGQKDNYPPQGNGTGDARDCEGNFDCGTDRDV